jgi:phenylalanyl-tRNA synthetase beta chain
MRVPLSWLREYVDFDLSSTELADRLTALGMEVQSVEQFGGDWQRVVVGELLEVAPHPHSARLLLTSVSVGADRAPLSIVCGATNIAVGQRVPVALAGSMLPGGRQIGVSAIAGASSEGMLCSGAELGLTADADGILILAEAGADGARPALGTPLEQVVGDTVIDVDVKPNRGDALSLVGLAREVAAISGSALRWPAITLAETGDATGDHLSVEVADSDLCPRFVGRWVDGLRLGPSPLAVQLRLTAAGMRPVSNVVDASNYVMLELGKPIHTFDAAAVADGHVVVRRARAGETIETLDHVLRSLTGDTLLIADARAPLGIAGVMGGAASEISDSTSAVIIESAIFDAISIRRTAHHYGLRSEASLRFEKGQESRLARLGADRTAQLIAAWAGGRVAHGVIDTNPVDDPPRRVSFRPARVNRLLGESIAPTDMRALLARVEITTESAPAAADELVAVIPPHRRDIAIEADVAEEIARVRGYETITPRLPDTPTPPYRADPSRRVAQVRALLAARGLTEVLTHALLSPEQHGRLGLADGDPLTIRLANPVAIDHSELRRSMLPGLLGVIAANERQRRPDCAIFEVGAVHSFAGGEPRETAMLGIVLAGSWPMASWAGPAHLADVADVKGIVEWLAARVRSSQLAYGRTAAWPLVEHPGRIAAVSLADGPAAPVGRIGELDPRYLRASDVRAERVVFATIELAPLLAHADEAQRALPLAHLPVVERDLAVVVAEDVDAVRVAEVIRAAAGDELARLALFDRYQGPPLAADEVSLAYRLTFQPLERSLEDSELDGIISRVSAELERSLRGRVRGPHGTA